MCAVLALFIHGCGGTDSGRTANHSDLSAPTATDANSDFTYPKNPFYVQVGPDTVAPEALPYCNSSVGPLICYAPRFVRKAYNVPSTSELDGAGQTILIVDAFGSPTIERDLQAFDTRFGLPAPPSFQVLCPQGCPTFAPNNRLHDEIGWSIETSLDVEWAHAIAPKANIVLVVAATSSGNAINEAEAVAIAAYPGAVMSQSFGIPEIFIHANNAQVLQAERNYLEAQAQGITVLASAGDSGGSNGSSIANALFPASNPLNTAVGGTMGDPYLTAPSSFSCPGVGQICSAGLATVKGPCTLTSGRCTEFGYGGEQVWNEVRFGAATGGAPSLFFPVPSFQRGLGLTSRTTPDVSYNAAINGGVLVAWSALAPAGSFFIVGGTSAGAPQWAGHRRARQPEARREGLRALGLPQSRALRRGRERELRQRLPRHHRGQQQARRDAPRLQRRRRIRCRFRLGHPECCQLDQRAGSLTLASGRCATPHLGSADRGSRCGRGGYKNEKASAQTFCCPSFRSLQWLAAPEGWLTLRDLP